MLLTLLLWIYVSIISFLAGDALVSIGRRLTGTMPVLAAPVVCLLGVAGLTAVLGWAWLLVPINLTTHTLGVGLLVAYGVWQQPRFRWLFPQWHRSWPGWLTVCILYVVIWVRSAQLPRLVDTGGYHAPMIEWIHQYAIVPGLANLNYRFGFNNSWFLFNALFRFQLAPAVPWHGLNGWLMAIMGWFSLTEWHRYQISQRPFSAWLGGWLAFGLVLIFHWTLSSPSPDLPTHVYVILGFWVWLRRAESDQKPHNLSWAWLLLVVCLSALTTKLSSIVVLLLPAIAVGQTLGRRDWRSLFLFGATILAFTGYWWAGNVVLSGYLVYPSLSPLVDWFPVDWKVPHDVITTGLHNLQQGTRGDTGPTFSLIWVPYWFKTRPVLEQGIFIALLVTPLVVMAYRKSLVTTVAGYGVSYFTAWLGVVFWFLLAPEIRFGAGTVLVALGLSYGPLLNRLAGRLVQQRPVALTIVMITGLALLLAAVQREPVDWLLPAGYPKNQLQTYQSDTYPVLYPTDDLRVINGIRGYWGSCYDATLPCSPYPIPNLHRRGRTLQSGFRTAQSDRH